MKLIAQNSVLINAAMRKQTNASTIAEKWLAHDATKAASPEDVQSAKTWVKVNVQMDSVALRNALKKIYGSSWAFGVADAKAEISSSVGFDWDTWEPGNEAAAVLADAPRGLRTMLDRRGVTIKGLNDTTLDRIGSSLALSLSQGLSAQETANAIDYILDDPLRSMVIARTESADAIVQANVAEYRENDITEIEWLVGDPCDICAENAGVIVEIGEEFPSGDMYPPAHPNCVCDVSPKSRFDVPEEDFELSANPDLVKYDPDQPRDDSGRFGSGSGGSDSPINSVANTIKEKTNALKEQGAELVSMKDVDQLIEADHDLIALADRTINDPDMQMTPEDAIEGDNGFHMTQEALNFDARLLAEHESQVVVLRDAGGQVAGASQMFLNSNDNGETTMELAYLGTTGIVDGAGSALFGNAINFANAEGLGLQLHALDSEAYDFWTTMGFAHESGATQFQPNEWLSMSSDDVAAIAEKIK